MLSYSSHTSHSTVSSILTCLRFTLLLVILAIPIQASAYIGDYDGIISLDHVSIKAGESYSFPCRGIDVERQRIEVGIHANATGKIDWSLSLNDTIDNRTILINLRRTEHNKYDFDHDESIVLTLSVDGNQLLKKDFGHILPISKTPIFLRAQLNGNSIDLWAGAKLLEYAGNVPFDGFADTAKITSRYDITLDRSYNLFVPVPDIPQICPDEAAISELLSRCKDSRCGIWDFFDEEVETEIALKGGRYKVALLPSESGGYDVIYISGAAVDSSRWNAGALKGHLTPTPFADTFTLYWIDSQGKKIDDMTPYATIEGAIMSFVFPIQKAKFRFVKAL